MSSDSMISGWYYAKAGAPVGQETGPLSWQELYLLARGGKLAPADLVWNPKLPRGVAAAQIPGLFPVARIPEVVPVQAVAPAPPPIQPMPPQLPVIPPAIPSVPLPPDLVTAPPKVPDKAPLETDIQDLFAERLGNAEDSEPPTEKPAPKRAKRQRGNLPWLVVLLAVVIATAGLMAYFLFLRDTGGGQNRTTTTITPSTTAPRPTTTTPAVAAPGAWAEIDAAGAMPAARKGHALVYDPNTRKTILFGGSGETTFGDTWTLDPGTGAWTMLEPIGSVPSKRDYHQMVYDPVGKRLILFGGSGGSGAAALNDTWAFDPVAGTWTELHPTGQLPPALQEHAMVYDPGSQRVILFGGWDGDGMEMLSNTWAYDPAANTWTTLSPLGSPPAKRVGHTLVYDPGSRRVILFGGFGGSSEANGANLNDMWAYDPAANSWTELKPAGDLPAARQGQAMVLDPGSGHVILFGGSDGLAELNDTWSYDLVASSWTELEPAGGAPAGRENHAMVYDEVDSAIILFGGCDLAKSIHFADTWGYGTQPSGDPL